MTTLDTFMRQHSSIDPWICCCLGRDISNLQGQVCHGVTQVYVARRKGRHIKQHEPTTLQYFSL